MRVLAYILLIHVVVNNVIDREIINTLNYYIVDGRILGNSER